MRVTAIRAENFLSFGTPAFNLTELTHPAELDGNFEPTILVGPNGAGKSNVLKIVQFLLQACRSPYHQGGPDIREQYHRPDGCKNPVKLAMGIQFDESEWNVIAQWWKLALAYGGPLSGLAQVPDNGNGAPRMNRMDGRQREKYAAWLLQDIGDENLSQLSSGELIYEMVDQDQVSSIRSSASLRFEFSNGLILNLYGATLRGSSILDGYTAQIESIGYRMARRLPEDELSELISFLDHESDSVLTIPIDHLTKIPIDLGKSSTNISHVEISTCTEPVVLSAWTALKQVFPSYSNEDIGLGQLIAMLITRATVCVDNWAVQTASDVASMGRLSSDLLNEGDLASYLASLKNGSTNDRRRYRQIQLQFQALTSNPVDVQITVESSSTFVAANLQRWKVITGPAFEDRKVEPDIATGLRIELMTAHDLPLDRVGSGKAQVLFWVTLMNSHRDKVIFMDEPDLHFHPRLATKVAQQLLKSAAQFLIVSHSPYMVPSGRLDVVRRVSLQHGASTVSAPMKPEDITNLVIHKRGLEPDDRLFLYANVVVFVEGANDAEVLREWVNQWARFDLLQAAGIEIRACMGKNQIIPLMRIADYFGIPCMGVWDFDVLMGKSVSDKDAINNGQILEQWEKHQMVDPLIIGELRLDNEKIYDKFPSGRVFLIGNPEAPNLEAMFKKEWGENWFQELNFRGYYGPITYREWAKDHRWVEGWEIFLMPLFKAIRGMDKRERKRHSAGIRIRR